MAAVQDISDRQIAELVTNLARGRSVATTAARMHMAPNVVEEIGRLNGYPDTVELNRNARALNKRLRDAPPVEDLEADVPISVPREPEGSGSGVSVEVEEPEADEPDAVIWRCAVCDFDVVAPESASLWDVRREVADHEATHQLGLSAEQLGVLRDVLTRPAEPEDAEPPAVGSVGVYECPECPWTIGWAGASDDPEDDREADDYREQQIEDHAQFHRAQDAAIEQAETVAALAEAGRQVALAASAHNHTDEEVRYPTCPACRAASEVPLVVLGDVVDDERPARTNGHEPLKLAELLAPTRGFAHRLSSEESPSAEAHPSDVPAQPSEGVEELPAAPAPIPAGAGWLASGPRTVEQLLDEAEQSGSPRLMAGAAAVRETLQVLADLVDDWVAKADQRKAILHELDILGRRQDELTEKLARLDAGIPELHPVDVGPLAWPAGGEVVSQTPASWKDAAADLTQPIPEPVPVPKQAKASGFQDRTALWFQLTTEARARILPWAKEAGVDHAATGRQPKATVEAYLAAHPEDDPR